MGCLEPVEAGEFRECGEAGARAFQGSKGFPRVPLWASAPMGLWGSEPQMAHLSNEDVSGKIAEQRVDSVLEWRWGPSSQVAEPGKRKCCRILKSMVLVIIVYFWGSPAGSLWFSVHSVAGFCGVLSGFLFFSVYEKGKCRRIF